MDHHWKVDVRLPEKGNSNSHGARPVHYIISMIKWIRTSRLSVKNSLSRRRAPAEVAGEGRDHRELVPIDGRVRGQDRAAPGANLDTTPGI